MYFFESLSLIELHLWIPQAPSNKKLAISSLVPPQGLCKFDPLMNIDFGGIDGIKLVSLTKIVVHMVSKKHPIGGLEVVYTDHSLQFRTDSETELSFLMDREGSIL